ncbi:hypothetical protein ACTNEN_09620 [Oribacterium sp. HCP28S3_H8]|uniref:hypothetical protein n=1 Tax=Oribacterium sp. HCP28S3_H8 TaxID=3438945 RepID=UPI003F8981C3
MTEIKKERPQDRWNRKAGYVSKSYKLKKDIVEAFATACESAGVSQASQLTKMMQEFVETTKKMS